MATMSVSIPDPMRDWVEARVQSGSYDSASDYMRDLIRRDQAETDARAALVSALETGERSGISKRRVPDIMAALKTELSGAAE